MPAEIQDAIPRPPALERRPDELPPWGVRECLAGLGVAVAILVALVTIATLVAGGKRNDQQSVGALLASLALTVVFEAAIFGIAVWLSAGTHHGGLALLGWRPRPPTRWLGTTALCVFLAYLTLAAYSALTRLPGLDRLAPQSNVPEALFKHNATVMPAILLTVVVAPIAEETFFRGFLFSGMRRRLGFAGAATTSGVLFAVAHASPSLIIPFTVIGVIFAYAYRRTGTLWTNVAAHFLFNFLGVLLALATIGRS